jgi:hypothetical protein
MWILSRRAHPGAVASLGRAAVSPAWGTEHTTRGVCGGFRGVFDRRWAGKRSNGMLIGGLGSAGDLGDLVVQKTWGTW